MLPCQTTPSLFRIEIIMASDQDFNFTTPIVTRKRGAKPTVQQRTPPPADVEPDADDSQDQPESQGVKEKPKYDPDELAAIFDDILFSEEYSEEVTIRSKLRVTFRTRTAEEVRTINQIVDGTTAVFATTLDGIRSIMQLQYALIFYQGKDLRSTRPEERAKFLGKLPAPVVAALLHALSRFDEKVYAACKEGEENF